jgi:hypothetical protein
MGNWMSKVKGSRSSEGGIYVEPGAYVCEVTKVKAGQTRAGVDNFIVELLIQESNNPNRKPGTLMDWYVDLSKEPALGNVKHFVMVATSCTEEEISEEVITMICSEANPLKGTVLRVAASNIKTKAGRDFTKVKFLNVDATEEQIAAANKADNKDAA